MNRSWDTKPFLDMIVTSDTKCPDSHPDEVVYETWLGSKGACDCWRDEHKQNIDYTLKCEDDEERG